MSKFWMTLVMLLGLALTTGPLFAEGRGQGKDKDRDDRIMHRDRDRDHDRDRDDPFARRDRDRPAGWSHGRKTGWGNCDLPPGQAKKHGCHHYGHRYYRARTVRKPAPLPIVRRPRPEVHVQGSVDAGVR
jgi:hypothetical protein